MKKEIEFYKLVDQDRFTIDELENHSERVRAALHANKLIDLARVMKIEHFPAVKIPPDKMFNLDIIYITQAQIEEYLNKVYVENLSELNPNFRQKSVEFGGHNT